MIRLGLRLTLRSGREALLRVAVTAAAVALGVALLLSALAGVNGLHAQADRGAWLNTSALTAPSTSGGSTPDPLWWLYSVDQFHDQAIDRVDVAATGPSSPILPGVRHVPGAGEFYASPALTRLIASEPASELGDRFPGRQVGTIGAAALPSPDSLVVVVGHDDRQLSSVRGAVEVRGIQRTLSNCFSCQSNSGSGSGPILQWILAGGAVVLFVPVLILIATASRLSAARREERFAAIRLVGATPHQVSVIAAVEASVAAFAGVAAGFALYHLLRLPLTHVQFTGAPLAPGDLSLTWNDVLLVVIGIPIAAVVSARAGLRRVRISPLGVTRRVPSAPPGAVRMIPLVAGIALLAYFAVAGKPEGNGSQMLELVGGIVLILVGLMLAGPWLTRMGSQLMAARANRPATLIAGRRLLDNPRAAFRSISGLVLALFVTSAAIGALGSIVASTSQVGGPRSADTLAVQFCGLTSSCDASTSVRSAPAEAATELRGVPGVRTMAVVRVDPSSAQRMNGVGVISCEALAKTPAIGKCAPGSTVAMIGFFLGQNEVAKSPSLTVWPSAHLSVAAIASLPVEAVVVATDGSPSSMERARTSLVQAFPFRGQPVVVDSIGPSQLRLLAMIRNLTQVVVVASLIIAACSLAVNIAAGLSERKRPFSLLRLMGVPTAVLRRVVALESALPLLLVAFVSIVVGLLAAALFLRSQLDFAFRLPGITYWATVICGLAAALVIIASTFPLLSRMTGPEVARNE
jgi:ABC-type antimicrobial peptide transport system permease subunit